MALADPVFISTDVEALESEIVAAWEAIAQKTLFPGQAERLLLNTAIYREAIVRVGIQYVGEQNLVNYADGVNLDQLGALVGAPRLDPAPARCTVQFTLGTTQGTDLIIPQGTRVRVPGATILFGTDEVLTITAGNLTVTGTVTAETAGIEGNGFAVGSMTQLVDPIPGVSLTPSNTTESTGGSDAEADDPYRERLKLAPAQFSVAGPVDAYKFFTLSVSPTIIDAAIVMPFNAAGGKLRIYVDVYPLVDTGIPSAALIAAVQASLDDDQIRPLNDIVTVKAPAEVNYSIDVDITLLTTTNIAETTAAITTAVDDYVTDRAARLGQDIVVAQIVGAITAVGGVYDVVVNSPATDTVVEASEWSNHSGTPVINIVGVNEG